MGNFKYKLANFLYCPGCPGTYGKRIVVKLRNAPNWLRLDSREPRVCSCSPVPDTLPESEELANGLGYVMSGLTNFLHIKNINNEIQLQYRYMTF